MKRFTRREIIELLEVDEGFVVLLEEEEIISGDRSSPDEGLFTEEMLERVRVADTLIHELEVNLAGAAIILRMREDMAGMRHRVEDLLAELSKRS
jgi:hypothetical protein